MYLRHVHKYPCPVCGYLVFDEVSGSYDNCPICGWEDDNVQLRWPTISGANKRSLLRAQQDFSKLPLSDKIVHYTRDTGWFPIDDNHLKYFEDPDEPKDSRRPWPLDDTVLYWWRDTYWLAKPHEK